MRAILRKEASWVTILRGSLGRDDRFRCILLLQLLLINRIAVIDCTTFHTRAVLLLVVGRSNVLPGGSFIGRFLAVFVKLAHVLTG